MSGATTIDQALARAGWTRRARRRTAGAVRWAVRHAQVLDHQVEPLFRAWCTEPRGWIAPWDLYMDAGAAWVHYFGSSRRRRQREAREQDGGATLRAAVDTFRDAVVAADDRGIREAWESIRVAPDLACDRELAEWSRECAWVDGESPAERLRQHGDEDAREGEQRGAQGVIL